MRSDKGREMRIKIKNKYSDLPNSQRAGCPLCGASSRFVAVTFSTCFIKHEIEQRVTFSTQDLKFRAHIVILSIQ